MGNWGTISHVSLSCSQYTEYLLNTSSTLRLVSKQSRSSEYLSLYFVLCIFKRSYDACQNLRWTVRASIRRSRYFLKYHPSSSNITRCQVLHMLGCGFMIQWVIFQPIRINYFTWKYNIYTWRPFHSDSTWSRRRGFRYDIHYRVIYEKISELHNCSWYNEKSMET